MRKVFYSSAVFASLFLAIQGCKDPSKIEVKTVEVEQPDVKPDLKDIKLPSSGCNKKPSELAVSQEAEDAGVVVEKDVKMKRSETVNCQGEVVYADQAPADLVVSEVDYQADPDLLDHVGSVQIENKRSCATITLQTLQPGEGSDKASDGFVVSNFHSDGALKIALQQFSPVQVLLGLGQLTNERVHVFEGLNLIEVRFLGFGGELLDTKEFRLDYKTKAILLPGVETIRNCIVPSGQ